MNMLLLWAAVFVASLTALVKGAGWLLETAEKIGRAAGLSPFVIGVIIVGLGTSFPELISAFAATIAGVTELVAANAAGSNIANILLIVGASAVIGRRLVVTKNLIDLELPLLAVATVLFLGAAWSGEITRIESLLLLAAYAVYILYSIMHVEDKEASGGNGKGHEDALPSRAGRRRSNVNKNGLFRDIFFLILGVALLGVGAKYLVDSVVALSTILGIGVGAITLFAVAFGTSLPELVVSAKAAWQKKSEVALGNIFGSNVFNILVVVGLPGLFGTLALDEETLAIGLPALAAATFLFVLSGISRQIHIWEGAMYLVVYALFLGKLFHAF